MRLYPYLFLFLTGTFFQLSAQTAKVEPDQQEFTTAIYFATASAELDGEAQAQLQTLIEQTRGMGDYRLELAAYTDSRGTSRYNDRLAQDRANSVIQYLENNYVTTDGMRALAFGESQAGNDLNSEEKQRNNRRVDVIISGWYWQGLGNLRDSLAQPHLQRFTKNAEEDQLLEGRKGGRYFIAANSFVTAEGQEVTGQVEIELTECYTLGDMISLGLTTTAQDRILESGGMLKINAYQNGESLQLKPGSDIAISVPTPQYRDNMSVFYGLAHEEEESTQIDWANSEDPVLSEFPRLTFAKGPVRPARFTFGKRYFKEQVEEDKDPRRPNNPSSTKPVRPREPNYDKVTYRPKGWQKIFVGKATKNERTAELKEERRISYEEAIKSYEERIANYQAEKAKHQIAMEEFRAMRAAEVDDEGFINIGPAYEFLQAQADSAFQTALIKYRRDSTAYAGYRRKKAADYERRMDALGQVDAGVVKSYFMTINQLGWANIDRFLKTVPNTPLAVRESETTDPTAMVFLMIPSRNIILPMHYDRKESFVLNLVPLGETVKILAIKIKDQKAYLASQEIIVTDDLMLTLDYQPGRLRDIREELAGL